MQDNKKKDNTTQNNTMQDNTIQAYFYGMIKISEIGKTQNRSAMI